MTVPFHGLRARFFAGALCLLAVSCTSVPGRSAFEVGDDSLDGFPLNAERYMRENVNGSFPETIRIKTRTQSYNAYHYYLINDGLIWYKGLSRATGPTKWTLLQKTGLPHNNKRKGFHVPRKIVEISADADELSALSEEGWFYRIVFNKKSSRRNSRWEDIHGWPSASPLRLNGFAPTNRGWAIGKRNADVLYNEDIFGNQHHFGTAGIMTNYVLLADGQEIRFADPGLPSDFSRTLIGPERGAFIAESIAASASTIFLIGAAGEMYTRLADFDTIGCNPMLFRYTYKQYVSKIPGTKYDSIMEPWGLPGEDWRSQPRIPLRLRAAVSRRISIVQNGRGNSARELRVAGRDEEGEVGYWSKPIFGDTWSFVRAPLAIPENDFLHPETFTGGKGPRGPIADQRYSGFLWREDRLVPGLTFEIPDFNILEGPCRLIIRRGEERASIIFHPVEAWTYIRRVSPGRDGTPKVYMATMEIPENAFTGISAEFREELERSIVSSDREPFRYFAEATTDYLLIQPRDRTKTAYTLFLTPSGGAIYNPEALRTNQAAALAKNQNYDSEELVMPSSGPFVQEDLEALKARIAANELLASEMAAKLKAFSFTQRKADVSRFVYSTLNLVSHVTLLYRNRYVYVITRHGGAILARNKNLLDTVSETRTWLDGMFLELIEKRIEAYSEAARALEAGSAMVYLSRGYAENYSGYMAAADLPTELPGSFVPGPTVERFPEAAEDGTLPARLHPVPIEHDFPGWLMDVGEEPAFSLLVELKGAAKKIYNRGGISAAGKPLTLGVRLHLVSTGTAERDRELYSKTIGSAPISEGGIKATLRWDGSTLVITRIAESSKDILFRGSLPAPHP